MDDQDTASRIIDVAQELVQTRGYNAFSYKDIEARIGIRTASIHYHFPTKGDLGVAIVRRYRAFVNAHLARYDAKRVPAPKRLELYAGLLESVLTDGNRMCAGGMLASDYATLPAEVQAEVRGFIAENERWIAGALREGRAAGTLAFRGSASAAATTLFSALEGAMLVARSCGDPGRYRDTAEWLIGALVPARAATRRR